MAEVERLVLFAAGGIRHDDAWRASSPSRRGYIKIVNPLAVPVALAGAGSFAVSAVLQQRDARDAPAGDSLSWRLIADLLRRRAWLLGMGCVLLGFAFQATALSLAPVAVVEPLIATELVLALPLASGFGKRRLGVREWLGAAAVSAGVGIFMAVSSPAGGDVEPSLVTWVLVGLPVLAAADRDRPCRQGRDSEASRHACGSRRCLLRTARPNPAKRRHLVRP